MTSTMARCLFSIVAYALLVGGLAHAEMPPYANAIPLSIFIYARSETKVGKDLVLDIRFTNTSNFGKYVVRNKANFAAEAANITTVTREDGTEVPLTPFGKRVSDTIKKNVISPVRNIAVKLDPGASLVDHEYLNRIYDLSEPGTYVVAVKHPVRYVELVDANKPLASTPARLTYDSREKYAHLLMDKVPGKFTVSNDITVRVVP